MAEYLTTGLILIFGYVEPLYNCLKIVKRKEPEVEQLVFWCKQWIVFVWLSVCARMANMILGWVPLLNGAIFAILMHFCFNRTKGTAYIYERLLRGCVLKPLKMIDHFQVELVFEAILHCANCAVTGIYVLSQYYHSEFPPEQAQGLTDEHDASSTADELHEGATPAHIESSKTEKCNDNSSKTPRGLQGRRRMIWVVLALLSVSCAIGFALVPHTQAALTGLKLQDWALLRNGIISGVTLVLLLAPIYAFLFYFLAFGHDIEPVELHPVEKLFIWIVLYLACLGIFFLMEDSCRVLSSLSVCFEVIPFVNLLSSYENFGILGCSMLLAVELMVVRPQYAPYMLVGLFISLLWMMDFDEHLEEEDELPAEEEKIENLTRPTCRWEEELGTKIQEIMYITRQAYVTWEEELRAQIQEMKHQIGQAHMRYLLLKRIFLEHEQVTEIA